MPQPQAHPSPAFTPQVSVVIPVYNGALTLAEQLDALADQGSAHPFEVLICDNGSTDGTRELALAHATRFHSLRIIDASSQRGAPYARNVGILAALAPIVAFVDADDVVASDWLATLAPAVSQGRLIQGYLGMARLNHSSLYSGDGIERTLPTLFDRYLGVGSGNIAAWREDLLAIGGFDESLRNGLEDSDLALRAQQAGLEVSIVPALVHCRLRAEPRAFFRQQVSYGRGGIQFKLKHAHVQPPAFSLRGSLFMAARRLGPAFVAISRDDRSPRSRLIVEQAGAAVGQLRGHLAYRLFGRPPQPQYLWAVAPNTPPREG